ncbi:hypothetical protein DPM19_30265 [Actinomadura craniellae]|uniref:Uncharacterized protein n=1 Tax=Actinomadura craniellae TaxID=2231787 RepID=A0A365GXM1_9ACTN|nr:DUF5708 family protein [Actinomadura craniellae]RAY11585.1 hypothetical protein DPM19_30265 [Actinomadura craniellae]
MAPARRTLLTGSITFVVGLALWLFGSDEQVFIFTPSKVGVVLMVIGGMEALYGAYKSARGDGVARG